MDDSALKETQPDLSREWELEDETHRTKDDARRQINKAKTGAHVAATEEYLRALRSELQHWIIEIEYELDTKYK